MRCKSALLSILVSASCPAYAASRCVQVPKDAAEPPVRACETATTYEIDVTGEHHSYDKQSYRTALRRALRAWMRGTKVEGLAGSIEVWLAVPDANPSATQMRAFVRTAKGNFVAFLPLDPVDWKVTSEGVGILDDDAYPAVFGVRAGRLLLKSAAGASPADTEALMTRHGATDPEAFAARWWAWRVPAFAETKTAKAVKGDADARAVVETLEVDSVMEWIALREKAFAFSLGSP